ncbi:TMhelix containing protein [Vibrio phage 1.081.O._10N.286.52.C2]|nr:TMhelix containing protein [Vibrio phage 1.081.O._10N.286.52.C2]
MIIFGHVVGMLGMILICLAFWFVTTERYGPKHNTYLWTNMTGAILLTISLLINFNLGSFMIELFWIWISGTALWKNYRLKKTS